MVAAWMRADTGVGPSMASGSHMYSGIWADLPTAPRKSMRPMAGGGAAGQGGVCPPSSGAEHASSS